MCRGGGMKTIGKGGEIRMVPGKGGRGRWKNVQKNRECLSDKGEEGQCCYREGEGGGADHS